MEMNLDKRMTPGEVEEKFRGSHLKSFKGTYDNRDGRGQTADQDGSWSEQITIEFEDGEKIIIRSAGGMGEGSEMWIESV